jgi:hypothetical protein
MKKVPDIAALIRATLASFAIPRWRVLSSGESPQPGDVVGQRIQWPNDATGHVMIVGPNANFVGVGESEKIESVARETSLTG